ncbi:MAG: pilus assembly protein N-terminal domain-containing protein [Proteobacteria bacterium]|nr:pilus assembly protein N-terminal domain-containing protein [Pseudomonadota bacterium]
MQVVFAAYAAEPVRESLPEELDMFVGDSRVLAATVRRVAVANGKVVSVTSVAADSLLLMGESAGITSMQLWLPDGSQRRLTVRVAAADLEHTFAVSQRPDR